MVDTPSWTAVNIRVAALITTTGPAAPPPSPAMKERETATGTATAAATSCVVATTAMGDPPAWTAVNSHEVVAAPTTTTGHAASLGVVWLHNAMMDRGTVILTQIVVAA